MTLPFNNLHPKEIQQLSAEDLVRLLHCLLHCEARKYQLTKPGILVPFQINVPDGGRDGQWDADIGAHEYIPRPNTYYQCKAERITPASAQDEVVVEKKDAKKVTYYEVKPRVQQVLSQGGAYVFFTSEHEIEREPAKELAIKVREALSKANFTPHADARIEFLGCNRIADWANHFPSAIRFVREVTKNLGGLHYYTVHTWRRLLEAEGEYFSNAALVEKAKAIRETLAGSRSRVRLTGLSGLGKTRLVYESIKFIVGDTAQANSLAASAIYINYSDTSGELKNFVSHLSTSDYHAILIVDDCPPELHDWILRVTAPSSLSVVTIFHELQERHADTRMIQLEPGILMDVVENILKQDPHLSQRGEDAIRQVAKFTQGFPKIAKLITEFRRSPTVQELCERAGLFAKLLNAGKDPDRATLITVQGLALFRVIGGSKKKLGDDLRIIRKLFCPDVSEIEFNRVIEAQKQRKIIQETADTLAVTPLPLAVALAEDFLRICPGDWKEHIAALQGARLADDFAQRIEQLELSKTVEELARLFLEEKIPFGDAEYLLSGATAALIFRAFTVLNPTAANKIIKQALGNCSVGRLREAQEARRDIVRSLSLLVWDRSTFFDAASLLLKLAVAENESWANNATGEFLQLFRAFLSGTTVPAGERLSVIRDALDSKEEAVRKVAVKALGAAMQHGFYSRIGDTTLGGKRDAKNDWSPSTYDELFSYWEECYRLLRRIIVSDLPESAAAKEALASNIQGILGCRLLITLEEDFSQLARYLRGYWPEVKTAIRTMLEVDEKLTDDHRQALERWRSYLTPPVSALEVRLRDVVATPGWHHRKDENGHYIDLSRHDAENLAVELSRGKVDLTPYLPQLLSGEQQQAFFFGNALARNHGNAKAFFEQGLRLWCTITDPRNDGFLRGLFHGMERDYQTLTLERLEAESCLDLLLPLTVALSPVTQSDFLRVRRAIETKKLGVGCLRYFIQGVPLRNLPNAFIGEHFLEIAKNVPAAAAALFQVLFLHCHGEKEKFAELADVFKTLVLAPELPLLESHFAWEWHEAVVPLIRSAGDSNWLKALTQYLIDFVVASETIVGMEYLRKVASELVRKAPGIAWPIIAVSLVEGDASIRFVVTEFLSGDGHGFREEGATSPIWEIPLEQFKAWVGANLKVIPLLLDRVQLYTVETLESKEHVFHWHPNVLTLIELGDDDEEITRELFGNLFSFGSTGSRLPYWERRRALAQELAQIDNPKFRRIGRKLEGLIVEQMQHTKREELNEQARFH